MGQGFLASYPIGLREGLEATLVVSILVAYLVKSGRRRQLLPLWGGAAGAVALSVVFSALLTCTGTSLLADYRSREPFEAVASVLAVALVTVAYLVHLVPVLLEFLWSARPTTISRIGAAPGSSPNLETIQHVPA